MLILFWQVIISKLIFKLIISQVVKKLKVEVLAFHSSKYVSFWKEKKMDILFPQPHFWTITDIWIWRNWKILFLVLLSIFVILVWENIAYIFQEKHFNG